MNNVKQFLQEINSISFWRVLFRWNSVKKWVINNLLELQQMLDMSNEKVKSSEEISRNLDRVSIKLQASEERVIELQREKDVMQIQASDLREKLRFVESKLVELTSLNERREEQKEKSLIAVGEIKELLVEERERIRLTQEQEQADRYERQRVTWQTHQESVKNKIKLLCENHTVSYVEEVPFSGKPDNTILICDEYVVFDAKSPRGDDLSNFSTYIKREAEDAKKYAKQENVRTEIFFVVPSNTLETLSKGQMQIRFSTHCVYIIPTEALEPIMLSLKKIEEYEFAEQLSPEERENICTLFGRTIHHLKRRVQVDNFLANEALSLTNDLSSKIPAEFQELVEKIERAIKLNPPQDRNGKDITLSKLQKDTDHIEKGLQNLSFVPLTGIVPLGLEQVPPIGKTAN